jgi:phage-related protein
MEKPLVWLGSSLKNVRAFPPDARKITGFQLWRIQVGLDPNDWKSVPTIGVGVRELRIQTGLEHRIFYVAKLKEAVYVLHAFEKRTRKTPKPDLDLAKSRLRKLLEDRLKR